MDNFGKINKRVVQNKRVGRKILEVMIIMQERKISDSGRKIENLLINYKSHTFLK